MKIKHLLITISIMAFATSLLTPLPVKAEQTIKFGFLTKRGKALSRFSGVLFEKADSPIRKTGDIKGKSFMCTQKTSFGGGQMVFRHLIENGVNPFKETVLMEGRKHGNVVLLAIQAGMVDVGTVRSDTLERMEEEGKTKINNFYLSDKAEDDFPFVHTTKLYPEMLVSTLPHVSEEINTKVKTALSSFTVDAPALKSATIAGWTEPLDYGPVAKTLIINILNGLQ